MTRRLALVLFCLALVLPRAAFAQAGRDVDGLIAALDLPGVLAVMRQEGLAYAEDLEAEMLGGRSGAGWQAAVEEIYDTARLEATVRPVFAEALAGHDVAAMTGFFEAQPGRRIVELEIGAREAFLEEAVEEAAKLRVAEMEAEQDPRLRQVDAFIAAGDLIEANVAGGLNTSLAFWRGLSDGGFPSRDMPEEDMLAQVWSQEPEIRAETTEWLRAYLSLAYEPLSDADLDAYIAFTRTPAGQALNRALFAAFDRMFADVSYRLGREAARGLAGQEL